MPGRRPAHAVLAFDLGGSGLRAGLVDADGAFLARDAVRIADSGAPEIDPEVWWRALMTLCRRLARTDPAAWNGVQAIAVAGFTRTQVPATPEGAVLRPALLWHDTRAAAEAESLRRTLPANHPETANLNAFHPVARLAWLRRAEPSVFARLGHVLDPKDWLNARLTGIAGSDPVSLARLVAAGRPGPDGGSLLDAAGLPRTLVPPLRPPVSVLGPLRAGLPGPLAALAATPVITMANDTYASVVGMGALRPGHAYTLAGTTEVLGLVTAKPASAEGLLTVDWSARPDQPLWQLGGPSLAGGDTALWLLGVLGGRPATAAGAGPRLDRLLAGNRLPEPVVFLPFLQGERTPFWDPALRGAFMGLGRRHGPTDLAYAVLEGVACLNRMVLERAESATATRTAELRLGGGGAVNPAIRRIKADILRRPLLAVPGDGHGLAGAAIMAWTALGRWPDLAAAQQALVPEADRVAPDPAGAARAERLYALFTDACRTVNPLSRAMADGWPPVRPDQ